LKTGRVGRACQKPQMILPGIVIHSWSGWVARKDHQYVHNQLLISAIYIIDPGEKWNHMKQPRVQAGFETEPSSP
jgi:hypothetical protein